MLLTGLTDRVLAGGFPCGNCGQRPRTDRPVLVFAQASRPCGCLDRVADVSGYGQAVAAPAAVTLGSAVGAHQQPVPAAPQPFGDVVEDKMLARVARVRHARGRQVLAVARGDGHEPSLGDEPVPAQRLDRAAADLDVVLRRDRLGGGCGDNPPWHTAAMPCIEPPAVWIGQGHADRIMEITAGIAVQHGRACAGNDRAAHGDQPSGLSDNAAQGAEARVGRSACDGQGATIESERVSIVPGKDRVEAPVPVLVLPLIPILIVELVPKLNPELAPELVPEPVPRPTPELALTAPEPAPKLSPQPPPELALEPAQELAAELVLELAPERIPQLNPEPVPELVPDLAREHSVEPTSQLLPELVQELLPELLPGLANDCSGIDAAEGRIHPDGEGRPAELISVVEATDSLGSGGAVDRGRRHHGGHPPVADASDELVVGWREGAGIDRECHGISPGDTRRAGISRVLNLV